MTAAVAIVLISLAAPAVVESLGKSRLRATAELMASEIERAKSMAMTQGTAFEIQIDPANGTLAVVDVSAPNQAMREPKRLPADIHFCAVPSEPIRMLPRGPVRGGTLQLGNGDGLTISVSVAPTGRTQVGTVQAAYPATAEAAP